MQNAEFLKWIDDQIERKYREELLTARDPRTVKRMSLRQLGNAIGMAHSNISRLSRGGLPGKKLIESLAEFFQVPKAEVYRVAGIIEGITPEDEIIAEIMTDVASLPPEDQRMAAAFIKTLREQMDKKKSILPVI